MDVEEWKLSKLHEIQDIWNPNLPIPFDSICGLGNHLITRFNAGSKLYFIGNGGSAAEAMHLAAEFTGHCIKDHRPLPAISLSDSQSAITAIANDYGFEAIFQRQVEAFVRSGDTLVCLSTSGRSKNVLNAAKLAVLKGARVLLWTGLTPVEPQEGIEIWNTASKTVSRIQEIHLLWGHLLAEYVEVFLEKTPNT